MTVAEVLRQARALSFEERKELMKELLTTLDEAELKAIVREKHSILELAGLGEEIWKGVNAQEYIDELRSEWDQRP